MKKEITDHESIQEWHEMENQWWNKYSDIMNIQWKLTPSLNSLLRSSLEQDYMEYLYKDGGRLLDLGCGSGWLSLMFNKKGMDVVGIDFSSTQIAEAKDMSKDRDKMNFICADILTVDLESIGTFDSVFINAFLHHLPYVEIEKIMEQLSKLCKPGARIYMYEPLFSKNPNKGIIKIIDKIVQKSQVLFLFKFANFFNLHDPEFKQELDEGYQGLSPCEGPICKEWLEEKLSNNYSLKAVKGIHVYSLGFSMMTMLMKIFYRVLLTPLSYLYYFLDKFLFKIFKWEDISFDKRFILCSIKLEKK